MKKIVLFPLLFVFMLVSCSLEKDFTLTLEQTFDVDYNNTVYALTDTIDVEDESSDFREYRDDIESVKLDKITYEITSFSGSANQVIESADLKISALSANTLTTISQVSNINLSNLLSSENELTVEDQGKSMLEEAILQSPYQIKVAFNGNTNETPVDFDIKFIFTLTVKYKKKII